MNEYNTTVEMSRSGNEPCLGSAHIILYLGAIHFGDYDPDAGSGIRSLKGLAHAKIIKKSVILFRVLNMTI